MQRPMQKSMQRLMQKPMQQPIQRPMQLPITTDFISICKLNLKIEYESIYFTDEQR